jgi:hypothetical protein
MLTMRVCAPGFCAADEKGPNREGPGQRHPSFLVTPQTAQDW